MRAIDSISTKVEREDGTNYIIPDVKEYAQTYIKEYGEDLETISENRGDKYGLCYKFCRHCMFFDLCIGLIIKHAPLYQTDIINKRVTDTQHEAQKRASDMFHKCPYREIALAVIEEGNKKTGSG